MNRHTKHPGKGTYRRRPATGDRTKNTRGIRITASWDERPDRPAITTTSDRNAARRIARDMAEKGAYVIVEKHTGYGEHRTWFELDGPALLAERAAEATLAVEGHPPVPVNYQPDAADRARRWLEWMRAKAEHERRAAARRRARAVEVAVHVRELMAPPATVRPEQRVRARHTAGGRR